MGKGLLVAAAAAGLVAAMMLCSFGGGPAGMGEAEFAALVGKPAAEAERRLGPPDIVKGGWLIWEDRVRGAAGQPHSRAALRVEKGKVVNHGVLYRD